MGRVLEVIWLLCLVYGLIYLFAVRHSGPTYQLSEAMDIFVLVLGMPFLMVSLRTYSGVVVFSYLKELEEEEQEEDTLELQREEESEGCDHRQQVTVLT